LLLILQFQIPASHWIQHGFDGLDLKLLVVGIRVAV
jgi:hypothetical protein